MGFIFLKTLLDRKAFMSHSPFSASIYGKGKCSVCKKYRQMPVLLLQYSTLLLISVWNTVVWNQVNWISASVKARISGRAIFPFEYLTQTREFWNIQHSLISLFVHSRPKSKCFIPQGGLTRFRKIQRTIPPWKMNDEQRAGNFAFYLKATQLVSPLCPGLYVIKSQPNNIIFSYPVNSLRILWCTFSNSWWPISCAI